MDSSENTITLNHSLKPHIILAGRTNYLVGDNPLLEVATERSNHSNNLNPGWSTSLSLYFPSDIALYVNGDVKLRNNNSNTRKIQFENDVTVWENSYSVRETGSDSKLSVSFNKTWNSVHRFSISADCSYNFYRLAYHGSVETISKVAEWRSNLKAAYTFIWKRGQLNTSLFGNYNKSGFGKAYKGTQRFTPSGYVDLIINPSRNQQFSARVGYYPGNYPLSQIDPTLIQTNLLLWTRGNPSIKSISSMITSLGYKWWNSHVSIYAYLNNGVNFNNLYRMATPTEDGNGLILSYAQGTDWITTSLGVSTSWFITREFALAASGTVINFRKTKPVNDNKFRAQGSFQFQWFRSKYGVYASVSSPSYQDGFNGYVRGSMNYGIGGSVILGNWRLSLSVYNPFYNTKMREQWSKVPGGLYTVSVKNFSKHNSTKVVLSATYTIRYGKREMQQTLEDIKVDNSLMQ